jgi:hypothetical protein
VYERARYESPTSPYVELFVSFGISPQGRKYDDQRHDGTRGETEKARVLYDQFQ